MKSRNERGTIGPPLHEIVEHIADEFRQTVQSGNDLIDGTVLKTVLGVLLLPQRVAVLAIEQREPLTEGLQPKGYQPQQSEWQRAIARWGSWMLASEAHMLRPDIWRQPGQGALARNRLGTVHQQ